ncbi:pectate lyase [Aspergillus terreus]|uniref:Pectate lyase n=1 Tax=Aspergillus terreus TaxID=33178 RepID=A0A5M3Z1S5_ASPTE|nr:hypothetical protein ATETN484_0005075100 [Aspergillus terreus]GFF17403.1 pectate lyase [Aspergillus terreus]
MGSTQESFTAIPVLDYSKSTSATTKPEFLADLRHAIVNVGFFYLIHHPVDPAVVQNLVDKTRALFDLPLEKKLEIEMINSKHFLGYSRLGAETTARKADYREQFDFATELPAPGPDEPLYRNICGPNQWPDERAIPGFRQTLETYLGAVAPLADEFQILIAEALDLPRTALQQFFDVPSRHKMKLIKYPPPPASSAAQTQGVGPHKDSEFLTFLLQATPHPGLEVQNKAGEWIPAPPMDGSLVVNIGRALEALTGGVCTATTHRVSLAPHNFIDAQGTSLGPRFSIPVFQGISLDLSAANVSLDIPPHIRDLVRDEKVRSDAEATFNRMFRGRIGEGTLIHRVTSHQDVGRRWYPELLAWALVDLATAGSTIYLRKGTFSPSSNIQITKSGKPGAPYVLRAYDGEKVIIDGEALPGTPAELDASLPNEDRGILHIQDAEYWEFYDLELINGPYGVYSRDASNNHYERIVTRDNYETGFQLQGAASNNTVLYLDSYRNRDPRKNGESADGFACKEGEGEGNVLRGARLWNNVDDGLDLWEFESAVTIEDTISWGNGYNRWGFTPFEGDGNGFKLGGGDDADIGPANHVITNCIAFGNAKDGFTDNSQPGDFLLTRNTAWNNAAVGFRFGTAVATLKSNVAAANGEKPASLSDDQISQGNSWDGSATWSNSSFVSVDATLVQGARGADGRIQASDFLLPKSGEAIGATTQWS